MTSRGGIVAIAVALLAVEGAACKSSSAQGVDGAGTGSSSNDAGALDAETANEGSTDAVVVTATSAPFASGFVSQSVDCPAGRTAVGGGARFTDGAGMDRDGMLMTSLPVGNPPTGWAAAGSTQYSTSGGLQAGDRLQVFAVCALAAGAQVIVSASGPVDGGSFVSQSAACPAGRSALGGGAAVIDVDGGVRDGMLTSDLPTGQPASGWAAGAATQYTTNGGRGTGDRLETSVVCAAGAFGTTTASTTSNPANGFVSQAIACPSGAIAFAGGASFTDATGAPRDGMLMNSAPVGSPPTGWAATGSTQWAATGGQGQSDRMRVFVVCVP